MTIYKFPENIPLNLVFCGFNDDTARAIICAAKWLDKNPKFEPKFEQVFNVILNANEETKAMTAEVFKQSDAPDNHGIPILGVNFSMYAVAVTTIKKFGFDQYLKLLLMSGSERKHRHTDYFKWGQRKAGKI